MKFETIPRWAFWPVLIVVGYVCYWFGVHSQNYEILLDERVGANWATVISAAIALYGVQLLYNTYQLQKTELKETRNALKLQKSANAFFNMLDMFETIIGFLEREINITGPDGASKTWTLKGRSYFKGAINNLRSQFPSYNGFFKYNSEKRLFDKYQTKVQANPGELYDAQTGKWNVSLISELTNQSISIKDFKDLVIPVAKDFFRDKGDILIHYFLYIQNILEFIESEFKEGEWISHIKIFRAHLSNEEKTLILYYSLIPANRAFQDKIVKCGLLKNFDNSNLQNPDHYQFYLLENPDHSF